MRDLRRVRWETVDGRVWGRQAGARFTKRKDGKQHTPGKGHREENWKIDAEEQAKGGDQGKED